MIPTVNDLVADAVQCKDIVDVTCTQITIPLTIPSDLDCDLLDAVTMVVGTAFEEHFIPLATLTTNDLNFPQWPPQPPEYTIPDITINPYGEAPTLCIPSGLYHYEVSVLYDPESPNEHTIILQRGKLRFTNTFTTLPQ